MMATKSKTVKVRIPATTANCGPGFDSLGIACDIYNILELTLYSENYLHIEISGEGTEYIPTDDKNLVWKVIKDLIDITDAPYKGAYIKMHNAIPLSRGLGSSAAAIAGGLSAANYALNEPLDKNGLLKLAASIEGHPDNVAPAIFGGITISFKDADDIRTFSFLPKLALKMIVTVPQFFLSTKKSRKVLPEKVTLKDAAFNISHVAALTAALCTGNAAVLSYAFADKLHQPYRACLIPGMCEVFTAARQAGALGAAISGAGPSLIAFATENEDLIGQAMVQAFAEHNVDSYYMALNIDNTGVCLI
ncbi:homoserine kinase [Pectinatus frisingensis]|uniref:homoserine kinase n=1 Tax=Pectinatus frisingensis TaxID=865 RepID=UPI001E2E10C6|nr:homoserine kinase [Pectinatus frisingensis]